MAKSKAAPLSKTPWLVKAYKNSEFLNSPAARTIRVLTEMIEPADRLRRHRIRNTVVMFGSARILSPEQAKKNFRIIEKKVKNSPRSSAILKQQLHFAKAMVGMSHYYTEAVELSKRLTLWFKQLEKDQIKIVICSGGGPGIMAAANEGAARAGGQSIGLNISLPMEQHPNIHQTREISFEFHYFFIRKFWFSYLAKALVVFPGGFGTMDELFELLTLIQTQKIKKPMPIVMFGKEYWTEVINFNALVKYGMISPKDLELFKICDTVDEAFSFIKDRFSHYYLKNAANKKML